MTTPEFVIFTDLDGTLLDRETYSFEPAQPALRVIREKGIPLVLASSKTRAEIEFYRNQLEVRCPFIAENGGGVFIPKEYFSSAFPYERELEEYFVLELGTLYPRILQVLDSVKRETGIPVRGFSDLSIEDLVHLCKLSPKEAAFAKKREYDEPFMVEGGENEVERVKSKIEENGLNYVWGGKFHHILGKNDKGKAVNLLKELYRREFSSIFTIGIGDSRNDFPMLRVVDRPIYLRGKFSADIPLKNVTVVEGAGPGAWNKAILRVLASGER
jgi:mannosyl-3-phosphoglycerate phosphatase